MPARSVIDVSSPICSGVSLQASQSDACQRQAELTRGLSESQHFVFKLR
jgi:hypothetical protein